MSRGVRPRGLIVGRSEHGGCVDVDHVVEDAGRVGLGHRSPPIVAGVEGSDERHRAGQVVQRRLAIVGERVVEGVSVDTQLADRPVPTA